MKKLTSLFVGAFLSFPVFADYSIEPLMNQITLTLHTQQWVTTKTALVSVGVNAAVSGSGLDKVQAEVMQKLNQLADKTEWHIVSFDRQQDKSGLESVQITAQARLAQTDLGGLRDKAKTLSKPGETFTIDNVQFTPSDDELQQANNLMRANIYQQAKAEIDALNKVYPDQKYYLHQINFVLTPPVMPMMNAMAMARVAPAPGQPALAVGNKQEMQATVVLASIPETVIQKMVQH